MSVLRGFAFKKKPGISRVLVLSFLFKNREIFILIRRPITQPSIAGGERGKKNRSVSIVTVQWRLQPLLQMIPHVLLASTWQNKL